MRRNAKKNSSKEKYIEYKNNDGYHSFSEFLGIDLPDVEYCNGKARMYNIKKRISGDWCNTIKAAKASYKTELRKQRTQQL